MNNHHLFTKEPSVDIRTNNFEENVTKLFKVKNTSVLATLFIQIKDNNIDGVGVAMSDFDHNDELATYLKTAFEEWLKIYGKK